MLPLTHRLQLRQKADFFSTTQRWYGQVITIFHRESIGISQAAVIIPKKVIKKATRRNKLKRQLQNLLHPFLVEKQGLELVISPKRELKEFPLEMLLQDLKNFFNR